MKEKVPFDLKQLIEDEIVKSKSNIIMYEKMTAPISPENAIGRVSRMDAINNRGVAKASLQQAKLKLSRLEAAKLKVGEPDFGLCERCKKPINIKRVMLMPQNPYCIRCAR